MDPYLEDGALWPVFHHQFVHSLHQILQPSLIDRYRARIKQRHYVSEESQSSSVVGKEHHEEYIEIRQKSDGRLITLVDAVSPANKLTAAGRAAYLARRCECKSANANLVEVDLVLQGRPTLEYSRDGLPDWDYAITVTRSTQPERYEIYTVTLQKKLPRFRLPLADDDRDAVLDLQTAFTRCYDQGGLAGKIDYGREPSAPLSEENRRWINDLLTRQSRGEPSVTDEEIPRTAQSRDDRTTMDWEPSLTDEEIARTAYLLWERDGSPHGRDKEYWYRAIEQLRMEQIKRKMARLTHQHYLSR
jgi:hypothetical protein